MTATHEQVHAPVFAYEEVSPETVTEKAVETATEAVVEAAEAVAEEVVDLASMDADQRLAFFQRLADENAKLRRTAAELQTALAKVSAGGAKRTKKDAEKDARLFLASITEILATTEKQTTDNNPVGFWRYNGTVDVTDKGRFHFTVNIKEAKRG